METEPNQIHILVVDDNLLNLHILERQLKELGMQLIFARNAVQAIDCLTRVQPDLILLDVMMPGMDGFELAKILKEKPETAEVPIIFITALTDEASVLKGFAAGAVDYVTKPIKQAELLARVKTHLALRQTKAQLRHYLEETKVELEETNGALSFLLKKSEKDRMAMEAKVQSNIENLLNPLLIQLKNSGLTEVQAEQMGMIEQTLEDILSPFAKNMFGHHGFTPAEMEIVRYIKMGKSSKDIAKILGKSIRTIDVHRNAVRKKLGLVNQKANLVDFLQQSGREIDAT